MTVNRKCCDPKFDFRKKPRTDSITGLNARARKLAKKRSRARGAA